jgi:hypothetical protein
VSKKGKKIGPFILDADNRPKRVTSSEYKAWVKSLQASEEWRHGGMAFETIFVRGDWLPAGNGALNTTFVPHGQVSERGPLVFETSISIGQVEDGHFKNVAGNRHFVLESYPSLEDAIDGHERFLRLVSQEGVDAVMHLEKGEA